MEAIMNSMKTLLAVHQDLHLIGEKKVEPIKKGDMPALELLTREEAKRVGKLQTVEMIRQKNVQRYLKSKSEIKENATMTDVKRLATAEEREQLDLLQDELLTTVEQLKYQNDFNQQLIQESLRFVNLSLDLMVPHQEDVSYKRPQDQGDDRFETGHSLFDSKA